MMITTQENIQNSQRHRSRSENNMFKNKRQQGSNQSKVSRGRIRIFKFRLFRILNPTSGHQKSPRDFRCSSCIPNLTSGHQTRRTKIIAPQKCPRQRQDSESMQNSLYFLAFSAHRKKISISKHTTMNGTGATSTSRRFTSEIRCFFSREIKVFQGFRATAPQTYDRFRTSNGAADVLYVLLKSLTPPQTYNIFCSKGEIEM